MPVLKPLSGSTEAPQQHKQPSRKGKKAWRKNVDLTEVEQGLNALNDEIIRGGVAAEKDSADLFAIDTVGETDPKKKQRVTKTLRADEIIAQRSAVPAVSLRKRPAPKTSDGLLPTKRARKTGCRPPSSRACAASPTARRPRHRRQPATYDVWAAPPPVEKPVVERAEDNFIPEKEMPKPPRTLRHKPVSLAASGKTVRAVAKPKGGHSYNPLFEDYAARLEVESAKAVEVEKKRLAKEEETRLREEAIARSAAEADAAEARANLSEWDEDSAWEGFETDAEGSDAEGVSAASKPRKRKTTVQRNRIKRRKAEEGLKKHESKIKARDEQTKRIREIASEIAERDAFVQALVAQQAEVDSSEEEDDGAGEVALRRKKLGKSKLPEGDLELVLPDELQDSLRRLRPEGNLLKDRYRSLLVRGKVESRRRIAFHKAPKVKYSEKWSYKDFRL
ncbi:60S ribosome subunit biogenesis protein NOP53 [Verticillium alfalfae VaMs.102]|uniref:Ribosome biogenesis protein NOP53 n=1 Tax=Verticillium alfalfae (strain VaMs.102 / ATCC MYA-4576 / FGSC 10136) TaxID=526221 RepID=C9STS2_VERA1|nr:60S ribosome subunit biogenesis protein NOP53 [Verticillium alfalfae VaMs.102]EEY22233.1 p60 domain-containing protein [Verticillium alfalfae VaMs.102]